MESITKCPLCTTELMDSEKKLIAQKRFANVKSIEKINKELTEENKKLKNQIEQLNQIIQELQLELTVDKTFEHSESQYNDFADDVEIENLLNKLKHPLIVAAIKQIIYDIYQNNNITLESQHDLSEAGESINNKISDETTTPDVDKNSPEHIYIESDIGLTLHEQKLVSNYKNQNFDFQNQQFLIKVSEPEESQTKRWGGSKEATIFKDNRQGNYWIVNMNDCLYIVPQRKFKINEYSQDTLMSAFDCRGYKSGISEEFTLVKPVKVVAINADEWQLIERGILQF